MLAAFMRMMILFHPKAFDTFIVTANKFLQSPMDDVKVIDHHVRRTAIESAFGANRFPGVDLQLGGEMTTK